MTKIDTRSRKWFITINAGAECFSSIENSLKLCSKCQFAYILHNKDNDEQPHYHVMLDFVNARTFNSLCNIFVGAHIDVCEYWNRSFQYLLHQNDKDKYQYNKDELITSFAVENVNKFLCNDDFEKLTQESLQYHILNQDVKCVMDCVEIWGISQVNRYYRLIECLKNELGWSVSNSDLYCEYNKLVDENTKLYEIIQQQKEQINDLYSLLNERGFIK